MNDPKLNFNAFGLPEDIHDPKLWGRLADGVLLCPCCQCLVYERTAEIHANVCPAVAAMTRGMVVTAVKTAPPVVPVVEPDKS